MTFGRSRWSEVLVTLAAGRVFRAGRILDEVIATGGDLFGMSVAGAKRCAAVTTTPTSPSLKGNVPP
jgi:hypothetical protein